MPVNVAMQKPWSGIVRFEPECYVIASSADTNGIASNRIIKVKCRAARDAYNVKHMPMEMEGMLAQVDSDEEINYWG